MLGQNSKGKLIDERDLFDIADIEMIKQGEHRETDKELLEPKVGRRQAVSDMAALELMKRESGMKSTTELQGLNRESQTQVFNKLHGQGVSIRQFSRLSGLSKGVCERMCRDSRDT